MSDVYIRATKANDLSHFFYLMNLESFIIVNIYRISGNDNVKLKVQIEGASLNDCSLIKVDMSRVSFEIIKSVPEITGFCKWPVVIQPNYVISGLCSVARHLIKASQHKKVNKLLGFRDACLVACSEVSIWTKFCEIDMVTTINNLLADPHLIYFDKNLCLPRDFARFEYHLAQPVRMHNVYKVARENCSHKDIINKVPIEDLKVEHSFSEGPFMTLSDVLLFSCYQIFFHFVPIEEIKLLLPLTINWYQMLIEKNVNKMKIIINQASFSPIRDIIQPDFIKQSLYRSDPNRYKPEKRIFTKQKDITNSIRIINTNQIDIYNALYPFGDEIVFDWSEIAADANPTSGALPEKRAYRKCEQLETLAKAVIKLVGDEKQTIVDFCSGSGHLGIVLACRLPNCRIILVENKEISLDRARERIAKLGLVNVVILQSNLDYFVGVFDLGVSLHACGVATDLVIESCIKNGANFVCCPCCYGGIYDCHHLKYPRSKNFRQLEMNLKDYLTLAHAADQTHDAENRKTTQGFVCMDAIDTDRRLYAEEYGYEVHLGKLQPPSCTNKNNLLVGMCKNKTI